MLKIGKRVVCIDNRPPQGDCGPAMPLRLRLHAVYTVRSIHLEPNIPGYGVRLEELVNPSVIWSDGRECEWSYRPDRFRPLAEDPSDQIEVVAIREANCT